MQFGVNTLTRGPMARREGYLALARHAERLGFDAIGVNDHIVVPRAIGSRYPYTEGGEWPGSIYGECFDQLATLCFLAGCTEKIRLLASVMVVPHRSAVQAAKTLATVDVLSGGRLVVGCGVGWMREEFEAVDAAPFAERGRATDEYLDAFRILWTQAEPAYAGEHVRFRDIVFLPKPVSKPHPPLWIGGEGTVALKRVVRTGNAWYPVSNNPRQPLDTVALMAAGIAELKRLAEAAGRDPASIAIGYVSSGMAGSPARTRPDGARQMMTGSSADIAADIAALGRLGVSHIGLTFQTAELQSTLDNMQRFAEQVMPLVSR